MMNLVLEGVTRDPMMAHHKVNPIQAGCGDRLL